MAGDQRHGVDELVEGFHQNDALVRDQRRHGAKVARERAGVRLR